MTTRIARTAGSGARGALGLAAAAPALGAALGLGLILALGTPSPAQAHNWVVSTTPAEGETLTELPESFEIRTNDALLDLDGEGEGFAFVVQDAAGLYYGDGCVRIVGPSMFTTAALGAAGDYTASWQAVSADGHTISGSYGFTWAPPAGFAPSAGSAERPGCGAEPDGSASPGDGTGGSGAGDEAPALAIPADAWWAVGAVGAIAVALVVTLLATRRRPRA